MHAGSKSAVPDPRAARRRSLFVQTEIAMTSGIRIVTFCLAAAIFLSSCGYRVAGTTSQLPEGIRVIAVPVLKNDTPKYRIEEGMTEAVVHEFIARTKYHIVSTENSADAVLHGEIVSFEAIPAVFD